jgi:hypothetical protein
MGRGSRRGQDLRGVVYGIKQCQFRSQVCSTKALNHRMYHQAFYSSDIFQFQNWITSFTEWLSFTPFYISQYFCSYRFAWFVFICRLFGIPDEESSSLFPTKHINHLQLPLPIHLGPLRGSFIRETRQQIPQLIKRRRQ